LHTATVSQMAVYETIKGGFLDKHLPTVQELYKRQCGYMLEALEEHFPKTCTWTRPEGGMFIWVNLPEHIDGTKLLERAIARNVAFVPGAPFYADNPKTNTLRLSFVTVSEQRIRHGIAVLGELSRESGASRPLPAGPGLTSARPCPLKHGFTTAAHDPGFTPRRPPPCSRPPAGA